MPKPDQYEAEPLSEQRFERAVKKLLETPPKPHGGKKPKRKRQPVSKRPKRPKRAKS